MDGKKDVTSSSINDDMRTARSAPDGKKQASPVEPVSPVSSSSTLSATAKKAIKASPNKKPPKDSAFLQQRMRSWQPLLTPYNVLPTLFVLGVILIPLGAVFYVTSQNIREIQFDYTHCMDQAPSNTFGMAPVSSPSETKPAFEWRTIATPSAFGSSPSPRLCQLRFKVDREIRAPVYLYYRLEEFYQNQRMYAKSSSDSQLRGEALSYSALSSNCNPLVGPGNGANSKGEPLVYYPCGLVANSMFNDTIGNPVEEETGKEYVFEAKGITWPSDSQKYGKSRYSLDDIRPPPLWINRKDLVGNDGKYLKVPALENDERFQVWMRTAALPTFRKLYGKSQSVSLPASTYTLTIDSTFAVTAYGGTKSVVISESSWMGGRNSFLGIMYMIVGGLFLVMALLFLVRHLTKPRRLGDVTYLSWYRHNKHAPAPSQPR